MATNGVLHTNSSYTLLGTHAASISPQSWHSSTCSLRRWPRRGCIGTAFPVRRLPYPGRGVQLLRPRPGLLRRRLPPAGPPDDAAAGGKALPERAERTAASCRATAPLPDAAQKSDASRFTPPSPDDLLPPGSPETASDAVFLDARPHRPITHCHWCGRPCAGRVGQSFLRRRCRRRDFR
jgi:hypothetical protein